MGGRCAAIPTITPATTQRVKSRVGSLPRVAEPRSRTRLSASRAGCGGWTRAVPRVYPACQVAVKFGSARAVVATAELPRTSLDRPLCIPVDLAGLFWAQRRPFGAPDGERVNTPDPTDRAL